MVTKLQNSEYGLAKGINKKMKKSRVVILASDIRIILRSIIKIFQMVTETQAENEVKIWIRGDEMKTSRVVILACNNPH